MNNGYAWGCIIVGGLAWVASFAFSWLMFGTMYGLWGGLLGWMPASIIASIVSIIAGFGWPLVLLGALYFWRYPLFGA